MKIVQSNINTPMIVNQLKDFETELHNLICEKLNNCPEILYFREEHPDHTYNNGVITFYHYLFGNSILFFSDDCENPYEDIFVHVTSIKEQNINFLSKFITEKETKTIEDIYRKFFSEDVVRSAIPEKQEENIKIIKIWYEKALMENSLVSSNKTLPFKI